MTHQWFFLYFHKDFRELLDWIVIHFLYYSLKKLKKRTKEVKESVGISCKSIAISKIELPWQLMVTKVIIGRHTRDIDNVLPSKFCHSELENASNWVGAQVHIWFIFIILLMDSSIVLIYVDPMGRFVVLTSMVQHFLTNHIAAASSS